jgi:putative glutamine amidotransferase
MTMRRSIEAASLHEGPLDMVAYYEPAPSGALEVTATFASRVVRVMSAGPMRVLMALGDCDDVAFAMPGYPDALYRFVRAGDAVTVSVRRSARPATSAPASDVRPAPPLDGGAGLAYRRQGSVVRSSGQKTKPIIGIIGNAHIINNEYPVQAVGVSNIEAVADLTGAIPLLVPAIPRVGAISDLLEACDGFVFTGGRPNVHPSHYGHEPTEKHGAFDPDRDAVTLPLIRACVAKGVPVFGICRGFQEFNVAFGGTLHPEIREIPGRMNHRMPPDGTLEEKFEYRHVVRLSPGGQFRRILGAHEVMVNSLHGQGILERGTRIVIEGYAPDDTPEAIVVEAAPGFAMAVQWHPEWNAANDPVSRPLFQALGAAVTSHASR